MRASTDRYLKMRYQFMLDKDSKIDEHRKTILTGQNRLRQLVCQLRQKEKDIYILNNAALPEEDDKKLRLDAEASAMKDKVQSSSEELDMMIRCYRETQMSASQKRGNLRGGDSRERLRRRSEICFSRAAWTLNEMDGQLGIADLNISNFLFTRSTMSDDSVENILEMGYIHCKNLLPNQVPIMISL